MDDRDQPDANVVHLRRRGDPGEAQRKQLADTIFADQDDVGPFSRGNLVPPAPGAPPQQEDSKPAADQFFDRVQEERAGEDTATDTHIGEPDSTAAYFDQIGSQTPAQIAETVNAQPAAVAMPGSARLPAELPEAAAGRAKRHGPARAVRTTYALLLTDGRRAFESGVAIAAAARTLAHSLRRAACLPLRLPARPAAPRLARPRVLAVVGALLVACAALVAIVATSAPSTSTAPRLALQQASVGATLNTALRALDDLRVRPVPAVRTRAAGRHDHVPRDHPHAGVDVTPVANRTPAPAPPTPAPDHTGGSTPTSASQAEPSSVTSQQYANPGPATQTSSTPAASQSSGSSSTPAASHSSGSSSAPIFGANGTLAPGSSPNG